MRWTAYVTPRPKSASEILLTKVRSAFYRFWCRTFSSICRFCLFSHLTEQASQLCRCWWSLHRTYPESNSACGKRTWHRDIQSECSWEPYSSRKCKSLIFCLYFFRKTLHHKAVINWSLCEEHEAGLFSSTAFLFHVIIDLSVKNSYTFYRNSNTEFARRIWVSNEVLPSEVSWFRAWCSSADLQSSNCQERARTKHNQVGDVHYKACVPYNMIWSGILTLWLQVMAQIFLLPRSLSFAPSPIVATSKQSRRNICSHPHPSTYLAT